MVQAAWYHGGIMNRVLDLLGFGVPGYGFGYIRARESLPRPAGVADRKRKRKAQRLARRANRGKR